MRAIVWRAMKFYSHDESETFGGLFRVIFPAGKPDPDDAPTLPCCRSTSAGFSAYSVIRTRPRWTYSSVCLQHRGRRARALSTSTARARAFDAQGHGFWCHRCWSGELAKLKRTRAIGHARYSTMARARSKTRQPFVVDCVRGQMAIAHNGNLINADVLRDELERRGSIFKPSADSEIILHLLRTQKKPSYNGGNVLAALRRIQGAFFADHHERRELIAGAGSFWWRPIALGNSTALIFWHRETALSINPC